MAIYRCYYARQRVYVGVGSRATVEMYERRGGWPDYATTDPEMQQALAQPPRLFTVDRLHETHVVVRELDADDVEDVYAHMQADGWTDQEIIAWNQRLRTLGLTHASMSAGDVVEDVTARTFHEAEMMGWRELAQE